MKIRSGHIILTSAIVVIALGGYSVSKKYFQKEPYPPLDEQRAAIAQKVHVAPTRLLDSIAIIHDLQYLASDSCEGRGPGSVGHTRAEQRIMQRMREAGLDSFNKSLVQPFNKKDKPGTTTGRNIIGWVKGSRYPEKYVVISAHYDHLGILNGKTYYGASDNASGTACLLAMAQYFKENPQPYSLVFVAFDLEETGLEGAQYFVSCLPSPLSIPGIRFNLNIDMIARNDHNEIFACGIYQYPSFIYLVNEVQKRTNAHLLMGHDQGRGHDNWTSQSDHFAFYEKNIPFLYIGVEDHPDYHAPTDTYDKIDYPSYIENCNMIAMILKSLHF